MWAVFPKKQILILKFLVRNDDYKENVVNNHLIPCLWKSDEKELKIR